MCKYAPQNQLYVQAATNELKQIEGADEKRADYKSEERAVLFDEELVLHIKFTCSLSDLSRNKSYLSRTLLAVWLRFQRI